MSIKRIILVLAASLTFAGLASAQQQSKSDNSLEFNPHWYIQLQGGAAATVGETAFKDLISPAAFLNIGGEFTPVVGARFGVGGWQGKGYHCTSSTLYKFNFVQANADLMINFSNLVGGYKHNRVVSFYPFVGIGGYFGVKNGAQDIPNVALTSSSQDYMEYVWAPTKVMFLGRAGLLVDFRLGDRVSLNLEGNANGTSDHFNSKKAGNIDWQFNALAGIKINFGPTTRTSSAWLAAQAAAAEAAAAEAAARAAAEKAAAEAAARAAAEKAAAEAAARAAAEKAAAEAAAAARAKVCEEQSVNVFFVIGKSYIRKAEKDKLNGLCEFLKNNPDFSVELVGYADKQTGYPALNQSLSEKRAKNVTKYLVDNGVPADRISTDAKGDTVQPFDKKEQNRVVICTVE